MKYTATVLALAALLGPAQADTCLDHPYDGDGDLSASIAATYDALSPFKPLRETLDKAQPTICLTDGAAEALGTFGAEENIITVDAGLSPEKRVAVLLHEVRHLDQFARGICPSLSLDMRANARAIFALEADAMAIAHLVAWVARDRDPGLFDALKTSEETADIAAAFLTAIEETGDPSLATAAAFDAWYASDTRRERYYVSTCMAYLDRLEDAHSFAGTAPLPADFLDTVCDMPDATPYPCVEPPRPLPR
ncbi:MAG: hypothetical protein QNJ20_15750 [Paracoccaceae bacterium]|nr:hypothetical protein [Paracoccaceae bacterium]